LRIVFFTFYYPPDLCAGSFRAISLAESLSSKISKDGELHIITTHPNRYKEHKKTAKDYECIKNIHIHRINVPAHQNKIISQIKSYMVYVFFAYKLCKKIHPNFFIGTSSRLMTALLAGGLAKRFNCNYFIDLRDIFSETISELLSSKSKLAGHFSGLIFHFLEKRLLQGAVGVNVVSEGFYDYFISKEINVSDWTCFPNGIDKEFTNVNFKRNINIKPKKTILYAGNIGSGQGLDIILPNVAKKIEHKYRFLIIGAGGSNKKLNQIIKKKGISNVDIISPVSRDKLIEHYLEADLLFLHLNSVKAFKRVLPSKIFEYAVIGRPILAGLSGYSKSFLNDNVPHAAVFNPGDSDGFFSALEYAENLKISQKSIIGFTKKYSRQKIMDEMSHSILSKL
jgi:hypothetical protein